MKKIEWLFESALWSSRLLIILPVVFSLISAVALFIIASIDIWHVATYTLDIYINHLHPKDFHEKVVGEIIGAVDLYLIAVIMMLFSFGLYELFISKIDAAERSEGSKILQIHSLDQLKDKLAKVIVMVLVVSFFKRVLHTSYDSPLELLYFAGAILALALGLYFLHKGGNH